MRETDLSRTLSIGPDRSWRIVTMRLVKLSTRKYSRKLAQAGLLAVYIEM